MRRSETSRNERTSAGTSGVFAGSASSESSRHQEQLCPVWTSYGYGFLADDNEPTAEEASTQAHNDIDADVTTSSSRAFSRVSFPWGHAKLHVEEIEMAPEFTFYAFVNRERTKFTMRCSLDMLGREVLEAVVKRLSIDASEFAVTLVQADSIARHEIQPFKKLCECTVGAGPSHPILVLQVPLLRFDVKKCSMYLLLQEKHTKVIQVAKGFGSVFGNMEVSCGIKYWEVVLESARGGDGVFVGIGSSLELSLNSNVLSRGAFWGISCATGHKFHDVLEFYTDPFQNGDVVGVLLDMEQRKLSFFRNGRFLGVAFRGIEAKRLAPVFSLTSIGMQLRLLPTCTPPEV